MPYDLLKYKKALEFTRAVYLLLLCKGEHKEMIS